MNMADSTLAPSQLETSLQSNTKLESAMYEHFTMNIQFKKKHN